MASYTLRSHVIFYQKNILCKHTHSNSNSNIRKGNNQNFAITIHSGNFRKYP